MVEIWRTRHVRTCGLHLRRAGLLESDAPPPQLKASPKPLRYFQYRFDQIVGLTVGSNGRWCPKIRSMNLVWTLVPEAGADRTLSIEDMVWNSQRTSVSATVGRTLDQSQGASGHVARAGAGFPSKKTRPTFSSACQPARKGDGVLDNTAGSPPASWGLPGHVRS